jgi:hypothetical protein
VFTLRVGGVRRREARYIAPVEKNQKQKSALVSNHFLSTSSEFYPPSD